MMEILFPSAPRVDRKHYWLSVLANLAITALAAVVLKVISTFVPNESAEAGQFSVSGAAAIPFVVVGLSALAIEVVSTVKVARRRFHDRGKSGWWILIALVPLVGSVWYVVELGFLAGTPGPNRYGPPPRSGGADAPQVAYSAPL